MGLCPVLTDAAGYKHTACPTPDDSLVVVDHALYVPISGTGFGVDCFSTPDHASFPSGTMDLDVRALLAPDIWGAGLFSNHVVGQWPAAPNQSWVVSFHPNRHARLGASTTGSNTLGPEATAPFTFEDGSRHWHRVTVDVGPGVFTYYTAEDDGTLDPDWQPLGDPVTDPAITTLFNTTSVLAVPGLLWWGGRIYYVEVRAGIDGVVVANPDFRVQPTDTQSFVDGTGKTWTRHGTARIL